MSETPNSPTTNTPTPPKPPRPDLSTVTPYVVTRNGISKSLVAFAGNRGKWDGVVYQAPQVDVTEGTTLREDEALLASLEWYGKDNVQKIINVYSKRAAQDIHDDSIPDKDNQPGFPEGSKAGVFVESCFLAKMEKFAAASQRISELMELYEDAVKTYQQATSKDMINEVLACGGDTAKLELVKAKYQKMSDTINTYKMEIEERRNRRSQEAETNTVTPE